MTFKIFPISERGESYCDLVVNVCVTYIGLKHRTGTVPEKSDFRQNFCARIILQQVDLYESGVITELSTPRMK